MRRYQSGLQKTKRLAWSSLFKRNPWQCCTDSRFHLRGPSVGEETKFKLFLGLWLISPDLGLLGASVGQPVGRAPELQQQQSTFQSSRSYTAPVAIKIVLCCFAANHWTSSFLALVLFCSTTLDYDCYSVQTCHVSVFLTCWALATTRCSVQSLISLLWLISHRKKFHLILSCVFVDENLFKYSARTSLPYT